MITGKDKTTIYDGLNRPLRDLRISVTDRCNFRCPYCMPAQVYGERYQFLPKDSLLTFEEIARVTRIMVRLGIGKVRLTGGEPLVRQQIGNLLEMLSAIEGVDDMAMTTNGYLLATMARELKDAGLRRITVSLDSLDDDVFKAMNGRGYDTSRVLDGIEAADRAGLTPIKINSVVKRGVNEHTLIDLARFAKERGYLVRFIEYMDVGTLNGWELKQVVSADEIVRIVGDAMPLERIEANYGGEVAMRYRYADGEGEIGIIASVTQPFCGDCTRIRLSPEGDLVTCLFASGGANLREALRSDASDEELEERIRATWTLRKDRYSEIRTLETERTRKKVEMYHIGG